MPSPRYTILIANRNSGTVRRFTLVRRTALLAAAGIMTLPTLIGLGARWSASTEIDLLKITNEGLQVENNSYRTATGELAVQITSLQTALNQLSERAQLDPTARAAMEKLPALVRSRAIGGGSAAEKALPELTAPQTASAGTFSILRDLLGLLDQRLKSVRSGLEARQALASATPDIWPVFGWLSSGFGPRTDPFTGGPDFHPGLDISADKGTPVRATADGVVEQAGFNGNYGNSILLGHGFGIGTRFGHLSRFAVTAGQKVRRNQIIGYVGATGRATSTHLHYEILINGAPINPLTLLTLPR